MGFLHSITAAIGRLRQSEVPDIIDLGPLDTASPKWRFTADMLWFVPMPIPWEGEKKEPRELSGDHTGKKPATEAPAPEQKERPSLLQHVDQGEKKAPLEFPLEAAAQQPATKALASREAESAPIQQHLDQAGGVASTGMSAKKNELAPIVSATTTEVASTAMPAEAALAEKTEMASPGMSTTTAVKTARSEHDINAEHAETIFTRSPSYRHIPFRGRDYDLTHHKYAPSVIRIMHEAHKSGEQSVTTAEIRAGIGLKHGGNMYDWFRGTGLWGTLVIEIERGVYRLDIPLPQK